MLIHDLACSCLFGSKRSCRCTRRGIRTRSSGARSIIHVTRSASALFPVGTCTADTSCSLWFGKNHSLNVYARVDIAEGDQLTMDYATFCSGPLMHPFDCMCKSAKCRVRITHLDYVNLQSIRDTFGTRVTDFIYNEFMNASSSSS